MTVHLVYLFAALCFILALKGLSTPRHARKANLVGALGMLAAVVAAFWDGEVGNTGWILGAVVLGTVIGVPAARAVKTTAIPQMVALFNGVGGAAAALVALTEFLAAPGTTGLRAATAFGVLVGSVSFSGSVLTFLKLQELMTTRPVTLPFGRGLAVGTAVVCLGLAVAVLPTGSAALVVALTAAGLLLGVLFVLPVGGADVPIAISLLNAFTGLAVAASGYVLGNTLLLVAGTLVGASGTLLTRMMAKAMGRPLTNILFGAFTFTPTSGAGAAESRTVRSGSAEDIAIQLGYARTVVVVPGYGLAVAQAQHVVRELADLLGERGVEVSYGIHPVAGRMPGHMNVLLAEADVPYEQLKEMEEVNPRLASTDVALVIGANDVVNPAARDQPASPIHGMPILDVDKAEAVVFLKRSMRPGFAGIENELLFNPRTTLLFGDAKDSLASLVTEVKRLA
ncbi:NAD(P) transhydrogenase subunit beta [Crossiella equi]|uniref:NAD(P) transhydrogenase subunit beta n=1 Tax=Crossiella equi TaxID=130796 RepID=A0ABS5A7M6_9PSEU|nr:NAD(P)(+) transhydrogenase (Re/Si-specific) subunit beta [Crossiella equi]MBP2472597.1 NAD(P) transhydrogenase subunit beta [Crossiella equi]